VSTFDTCVERITGGPPVSLGIRRLQVNVGPRCNQSCVHCHLEASPARFERMKWSVMELVLEAAARVGCELLDITGGAPELHPDLRKFIAHARDAGLPVQVRTNLTALVEPGLRSLAAFFRDHGVRLAASLPCYLEENVRAQRGDGVYRKSMEALRRLNALGYGSDPALPLDLVCNPGGPMLPPEQSRLEAIYREELGRRFGICFSRLFTVANMPVGRFLTTLREQGREIEYFQLLKRSFNAETLPGLMCRHQLSVGWDGRLYDCDFNLALGRTVGRGAPDHIRGFDLSALRGRTIVTGEHCFGCTAGFGSSCGGALA
jgi:radical SAM/Cys-rich protein